MADPRQFQPEECERAAQWVLDIVMHLAALRALGDDVPVNLKLVVEGSEEQGTGGLEAFVPEHSEVLRADTILVCDTGNAAVGRPAATVSLRGMVNVVVTVEALRSELHSGMFGGAAPDALAALIAMLATLRDAHGNATINGLDGSGTWLGEEYPPEQFRTDATVMDGVSLLGEGTVSDVLWARPAVTVLGIDCPPVAGSASAIVPRTAARLNLRIPPGMSPEEAQAGLVAQLHAVAPWGVKVKVETEVAGAPFECVEPSEVANMALTEALFLQSYGGGRRAPSASMTSDADRRVLALSSPRRSGQVLVTSRPCAVTAQITKTLKATSNRLQTG